MWWLVGGIVLLDQLFKYFSPTPTLNQGIAFSLEAPFSLTVILSIALLLGSFWWWFRVKDYFLKTAFALILAGGISNLLDRLWRGGIVDYFSLYTLDFNIADVAIVIGLVMLACFATKNCFCVQKQFKANG